RSVTEGAGPRNMDTCWYQGSPADKAHLSGGTWPVDANNQYGVASPGPDYIGWPPATVTLYRQHNRAPCGYNVEQQMSINCPEGGSAHYQDNLQAYDITSTQVSCARGTAPTEPRTWP